MKREALVCAYIVHSTKVAAVRAMSELINLDNDAIRFASF
jgi:hypothetical protein